MLELLKNLVSPGPYIPHGHCYLWQTPLVWLHVTSDFLIAVAYFSIPAMLIYFINKRRCLPFSGIFALFGAFIILCGTGHLFDIWTLWHPVYWLSGVEQAITALVSCYTAGQLVTLLPQFLALKAPEELEQMNQELQREIAERRRTEEILQSIVTGTASVTGKDFFPALVKNLAETLDVPYVFVSELIGENKDTLKTLAIWQHGQFTDNCEYAIAGTPCGTLIETTQTRYYGDHLYDQFPHPLIAALKAESYLGVPLRDHNQTVIGNLCILKTEPMSIDENTQAIMNVFAARAAAEIQRQWAEEEKKIAYAELEQRVKERTAELVEANRALEEQMQVRISAEMALRNSETRLRQQQDALLGLAQKENIYHGDLEQALREISELVAPILGIAQVGVWFYEEDNTIWCCANLYQYSTGEHSQGQKLQTAEYPRYFSALNSQKVIAVYDTLSDPRTSEFSNAYLEPFHVTATLDVPISIQGKTIGVLCLEHIGTPRKWSIEEQNFGSYLAYIISLAIESRDRLSAEKALLTLAEQERSISKIVQRMRQTLDLATIFQATTGELRQVLNCDRVGVYEFNPDWGGEFVSESVAAGWTILVQEERYQTGTTFDYETCIGQTWKENAIWKQDTYLQETAGGLYRQGVRYRAVPDIYKAGFTPCYLALLEQLEVKAYLIVPIYSGEQLWGLLVSYQHSNPRNWQPGEIKITEQVGSQLGVAVQQAGLLAQTQRQAEQLRQAAISADTANRAKSEFLANMSHELRTPLNAILGFTQVMTRDHSLSAENQQQLGIINRAGEHLLTLINDILEMSKIEAGRTTFDENDFDLWDLLDTLEEMFRMKAKNKGLHLLFEKGEDLPQFIKTDEKKLRQVLMNLLSNAIKFTQKGGISLNINKIDEVDVSTPNHCYQLKFEVADTGAGISPEELKQLFEPFTQSESGRKSGQGTGLGLPISQKFVQLMGGELQVTSQVNHGSVFKFDIQAKSGIAQLETAENKNAHRIIGLAPNQPEYRILIVEDRLENRILLNKILTTIGFNVREAVNGQEGIEIWQVWEPHLIWMDMRMPVMNGYEATRKIKQELKGPKTVIVALTASAFEEERQLVLAAGCDDFMRKPFRESTLLEKMSKYLGVQYIYEIVKPIKTAEENQEKIKIDLEENLEKTEETLEFYLNKMPSEWVKKVYQSAEECSDDSILELVQEIPDSYALLKSTLTDWANNFLFDRILQLVQQENSVN